MSEYVLLTPAYAFMAWRETNFPLHF